MKADYETRHQECMEMMHDNEYRPEVLELCEHTPNSCSMNVTFGDNLITICNTVSHRASLDQNIKQCMKQCIVEAMLLGYSEEDLKKRKITWLSINGSIIVDKR